MVSRVDSTKNKFLKLNVEKAEYNQYWFSEKTIEFLVKQIEINIKSDSKVALVSCPSVFFSLPKQVQEQSYLFDIDTKLIAKHPNGVYFDFNDYTALDTKFHEFFDFVLIDPPFIAKEPWQKFADFSKLISKKESKVLTCSIFENKELLDHLLNLKPCVFKPSIPHLVYQYSFYSNYSSEDLDNINPEIDV